MSEATLKKKKKFPILQTTRKIIQFLSFFIINYAILEWIFKTNFSLIHDLMKVLPFLHTSGSAWTAGAGLLEYTFHTIIDGKIPFLFLAVIGLFGLFTSRIFCGWVCPTGFIQDLFSGLANEDHKFSIKTDDALKKFKKVIVIALFLLLIPYGIYKITDPVKYLEWTENMGNFAENPSSSFSLSEFLFVSFPNMIKGIISTQSISSLFEGNTVQIILFFLYIIIMGVTIYYPRLYCKYICPYAAVISVFSEYSFLKLQRMPTRCPGRKECGICEKICPMQVRILDEPFDGFTGHGECILCLDCIDKCPHDAIKFKFGF